MLLERFHTEQDERKTYQKQNPDHAAVKFLASCFTDPLSSPKYVHELLVNTMIQSPRANTQVHPSPVKHLAQNVLSKITDPTSVNRSPRAEPTYTIETTSSRGNQIVAANDKCYGSPREEPKHKIDFDGFHAIQSSAANETRYYVSPRGEGFYNMDSSLRDKQIVATNDKYYGPNTPRKSNQNGQFQYNKILEDLKIENSPENSLQCREDEQKSTLPSFVDPQNFDAITRPNTPTYTTCQKNTFNAVLLRMRTLEQQLTASDRRCLIDRLSQHLQPSTVCIQNRASHRRSQAHSAGTRKSFST